MLKEVVAVFPVSGSKNCGSFRTAQDLPLTPQPRDPCLLYITSFPPPLAAPAHAQAPAAVWDLPGGCSRTRSLWSPGHICHPGADALGMPGPVSYGSKLVCGQPNHAGS